MQNPNNQIDAIQAKLQRYQLSVEEHLERWIPQTSLEPQRLHDAMRYAVLSGGKRIRPILVYAAGEVCGADMRKLHNPACAVEIIHAYSLTHDDLPSMDDDDIRRNLPTCHRRYDEATAILTGDALQSLAFYILTQSTNLNVDQRLEMINILAYAIGSRGMTGGQAIDLESVGKSLDITQLNNMHNHKTGALILASVQLGVLATEPKKSRTFSILSEYANCIGLAFQVKDDILDVEGETSIIGKQQGADKAMNKPTYPELIGLDKAHETVDELYHKALEHLNQIDNDTTSLRMIADYIVQRKK